MELANIILEYIKVLIWPITTSIIIFKFKEQILLLLKRAKKIELPGGFSMESFEEKIDEAKELAEERKIEVKESHKLDNYVNLPPKEKLSETDPNARMIKLGLRPSPSGLDLSYYRAIAEQDPTLALAGLRIDFEIMLKNLAFGSGVIITDRESIGTIIKKLYDKKIITQRQYDFMKKVFNLTTMAIHSADASYSQSIEILEVAQVLVDDYISWLDWNFPNE